MVNRKPKILHKSYSAQASDSNTDRCLTGRLGVQLQREMVNRIKEIASKYPRTPSGEAFHLSY